jgi:UDP-sugar transporter A1/2/3
LKWICLVVLIIQNAATILLLRYVRTTPGDKFLSTTAIAMQEIIKVLTSFVLLFCESMNIKEALQSIDSQIFKNPMDTLKTGVPAFLYTIQTNLVYIAISNLDAAVFQVYFIEFV